MRSRDYRCRARESCTGLRRRSHLAAHGAPLCSLPDDAALNADVVFARRHWMHAGRGKGRSRLSTWIAERYTALAFFRRGSNAPHNPDTFSPSRMWSGYEETTKPKGVFSAAFHSIVSRSSSKALTKATSGHISSASRHRRRSRTSIRVPAPVPCGRAARSGAAVAAPTSTRPRHPGVEYAVKPVEA